MYTKNWKNRSNTITIEDHQFDTFIPEHAKQLIIGTFHTHPQNFRFRFYYSGKDNLFWSIIERVFEKHFIHSNDDLAVTERKNLFREKNIGITDMVQKCYRFNNSSSDENIYPIILRNIFLILEEHTTIDTLIFTSRTEVFGALGLFKTFFLQRGLQLGQITRRTDKILEGHFASSGKNYKILVPFSPSPRLISENRTTIDELVSMYKTCLTGHHG